MRSYYYIVALFSSGRIWISCPLESRTAHNIYNNILERDYKDLINLQLSPTRG